MPQKTSIKDTLYWPPAVTVDVVIFTIENDALRVLLIKRSQKPFIGKWALPGGFILRNETTQKAALRILKEKAGVTDVYLEQLYTFDSPIRDPRGHVLTVAYFVLLDRNKIKFGSGQNVQMPMFHEVKKLQNLAFDHQEIIKYALKRLRYKLEYTNAVFSLLPKEFTLGQLQDTYEIILDKKLDKRNFRKKFIGLNLIKQTKRRLNGTGRRPAQLYIFRHQKPIELKRFF